MAKIISYDFGHGLGQDRGANGFVNEETEVRRYGQVCVDLLKSAGYTMVNCTPTNTVTLMDSLSYRTNHANASGSMLHLCFHINAFKTVDSPMGAEVEVASDNSAKYGQSILNEILKLGFKNRGINRPSLWVTKNTNMACVLIEPFFCDSKADCSLYNYQTLGKAIAQGVVNILGGTIQSESKNGWILENNIWHFYTNNGVMVKNAWEKDSKGLWYYLDVNGNMLMNNWAKDANGTWFYVGTDGAMVSNQWVKWRDKSYYLGHDGAMLTNTMTPDGYYVDKDGVWDGKPKK